MELSQITKSIPICSESSTIRRYTFLNTIMMLEMLKSFIPECLCFTLCRADPHSIHGRLQQRQIMVEFWVLGGWLIKTLQTHFINVSKSYLCCGTQRQSSRWALMHKTMFARKMCLHFILKKKKSQNILKPWLRGRVCILGCWSLEFNTRKEYFLLDWLLRAWLF